MPIPRVPSQYPLRHLASNTHASSCKQAGIPPDPPVMRPLAQSRPRFIVTVLVSISVLASSATAQDNAPNDDTSRTTTLRAISTSTISTLTTTFTLPSTTDGSDPASTSTSTMATSGHAFETAILNSTNFYRGQFLAHNVTYDSGLADYALNHAQKCKFEHSDGPHGENLAANFPDFALAIDAWANEESDYDYSQPGFSEDTGHFTQLVWENTTRVGCGATQCDGKGGVQGWFLVCEYEPRGNVIGQFNTMVRKPGIAEDGTLGFGQAGRIRGSKVLGWLAAVLMLAAWL